MSRFDLSNAGDFSRLTSQSLGEAVSVIDGRDISQWDIQEASYNGVVFHVFRSKQPWQGAVARINDVAGRRKVKYQFPYEDGQTTDDLGRRPSSFSMEIVLFGRNYFKGLQRLLTEFNKPQPGDLVHPVRGLSKVAVEDVQIIHQSDQRKAVLLNVTFIEHTFTVSTVGIVADKNLNKTLSDALGYVSTLNAAIKRIESSLIASQALKNRLNNFISIFSGETAAILSEINRSYNDAEAVNDYPSLVPTNEGGNRLPDGTLADDTFLTVASPNDPFQNAPLLEASTTTALASMDIQKKISNSRDTATNIIKEINENGLGLEQFETVLGLREVTVLVQKAFESGVSSSNAQVVDYNTPRLMSLREVAFANGLDVNRVREIDLLNPNLTSVNFIEKGTVVRVPVV
jgi:prophage DNA circulation protein